MFTPSQIIALPELAIAGSDRFAVIQVFQGGMGVCAKISHAETGELLALKMMRPELAASARGRARFEVEALAWVELSNTPGVVPAMAVARWNEIPFVAAAWMEGGDLATQMHRVNAELYFAVAFRVASALDAANGMHGIIHRDIKPSNILLDRDARPFVTDWGLAKMHREDSPRPLLTGLDTGQRTGLTVAGTFLGTVAYAAPEQLRDAASVDWRADLYSLGCVLYEMETGRPPFAGTADEIARQHLTSMPPTLPGGGRFGTADIVLHCLEKSPASRHDCYGILLELLEHAAARFGIEPPSRTASTPATRQRISSGAYAVISEEDWDADLSKATAHVAFGRYREAHQILARYFVPELLTDAQEWHFGHSLALNFAYCLTNVDKDQSRALRVFRLLERAASKPVEFYLNYSNALLRALEWRSAERVAREGRRNFPSDSALVGNLVVALTQQGKTPEALDLAAARLNETRDVHSLLESAFLFQVIATEVEENWPQATANLKTALDLLDEALAINGQLVHVRYARAQVLFALFQFVAAGDELVRAADADDVQLVGEWILVLRARILWEARAIDALMKFVAEWLPQLNDVGAKTALTRVRAFALTEKMIGLEEAGERIVVREAVEFYEQQVFGQVAASVDDYIECARIYDWMGRTTDALSLIDECATRWPGHWRAVMHKARFFVHCGQSSEAKRTCEEAIKLAPYRPEPIDTLAWIHEVAGEHAEADAVRNRADVVFNERMALANSKLNSPCSLTSRTALVNRPSCEGRE